MNYPKPLRILISINTSWNIVHFRSSLLRALRTDGHQLLSAAPDDSYTAALTSLVDTHVPLPMDNAGTSPLRDGLLLLRYLRLLRLHRPDILLTYTIKPNIYGALAARILGIPTIVNISGLGTSFIRNNWLTWLVRRLYRHALRQVSCVFFQNAEDRDLFLRLKLVNASQAQLISGSGVDLDYFHPSHNAPPHTQPQFVLIARMLKDKGVSEFVDAARIVKRQHPNVIFDLVGPLGVQNQTAISEHVLNEWVNEGTVRYLGASNDIRSVIAQHTCVVLPSYREGMSRVLLETAAMGKPIITTDVAGCRQAIEPEVSGLLCAPQDAQDLAQTLLRFLAMSPEQHQQMGNAGRSKAEREFGEGLVIDAYRQAIRTATIR